MLHLVTAIKQKVDGALDNAITAFQQNTPLVQQKLTDVLNPANDAEREQFRQKILASLQEAKAASATEAAGAPGDLFIARNPGVGLAQSAMNASVEQNANAAPAGAGTPFEQFGTADPGWIECVVDGFKTSIFGKATFVQHKNLSDFLTPIPDKCTIALVADWGANNSAAVLVAGQIRATNPDICIHLGDIYYAGQDDEVDEFLEHWPMANSATGKIPARSSFTLNGNHEMFSGGHGYFGKALSAFGQPASYFGLRNANWQFLGFDSAFVEQRLPNPANVGDDARLLSQWAWLVDKIKGNAAQQTILMSHHQPFSAFAPDNAAAKTFGQDAQALYGACGVPNVYGWFFGHEHRLTVYDDSVTKVKARLIGNGCIPHDPPTNAQPDPGCVPFRAMNRGENANGDAISGYVLMKLDGPRIDIQYVNEDGSIFFSETWMAAGGGATQGAGQ